MEGQDMPVKGGIHWRISGRENPMVVGTLNLENVAKCL